MVSFGNPVRGRVGPVGQPDPSSRFVITSPFGPRGDSGFHDGLDIDNGGEQGDPIIAMRSGRVYQSFRDDASGGAEIIRIDHGDGWTTGYAHMRKRLVSVNQQVSEGQQIGELGMTGWATGPHLHYDTSYQNERRDPEPYLNRDYQGAGEDVEIQGDYSHAVYGTQYKAKGTANLHTEPTSDSPILQAYAEGTALPGTLVVESEGADWYVVMLYVSGKGYCVGYIHQKNVAKNRELLGWLGSAKPFTSLATLKAGQPLRYYPDLTSSNIGTTLATDFVAETAVVVKGDEYNGTDDWLAYPLNSGGWYTFSKGQVYGDPVMIDYADAVPEPEPLPPDPCAQAAASRERTMQFAILALLVLAMITAAILLRVA